MKGISVRSEVAPLKKVLLHRPGRELLNLTPASMERLLFDDIPFLKVAQEEHDAFAQLLRDNGVEVVYLEDLMTDVLRLHPELKEQFLMQWLEEGGIHTEKWQQKLLSYLTENFEGKELILKTMEGINLKECYDVERNHSLVDMASFEQKLIVLGPDDILWIYISLASLIAFSLTLPFMVYQIWEFIRPALRNSEAKAIFA